MFRRENWKRAEADNNCAFNSFILAFCVAIKNGELKEATPGIKKLLKEIHKNGIIAANSLASFQDYINSTDPVTIQKSLQGIFRGFTVNAIRENRARIENSSIVSKLHDEFRKFAKGERTDDDIFTVPFSHPKKYFAFIADVFKEVYQKNRAAFVDKDETELEAALDAAIGLKDTSKVFESKTFGPAGQQLADWWIEDKKPGGSTQFLQLMNKNGTWAGDIELSVLADTLGVGLSITRAGEAMGESVSYGELKVANQEGVDRLIAVGYLDKKDKNTHKWNKLITETELTACLNAVPNVDVVNSYIVENNGELKGYDLCLMSAKQKKDDTLIMPGKIYIIEQHGAVEYAVQDKHSKEVYRGVIPASQLGITIEDSKEERRQLVKKCEPVLNEILKITSDIGHTKQAAVPAEWSVACKDQLVLRGILKKNEGGVYQFAINRVEDFARLNAIDNQEAVIAAFRSSPPCKPAAHITLNNNGNHWDNVTELRNNVTEPRPVRDSTASVADKLNSLSWAGYKKAVNEASHKKQVSVAPVHPDRMIDYKGESVTEDEQIKRDEKYARQLQQQEFGKHDKSRKLKK